MRIALSTVALIGLSQAASLTSQAEASTEATYSPCPETILPPGSGYPTDDYVMRQAEVAYDCQ